MSEKQPKPRRKRSISVDEAVKPSSGAQAVGVTPLAIIKDEDSVEKPDATPMHVIAVTAPMDETVDLHQLRSALARSLRQAWSDKRASMERSSTYETRGLVEDLEAYLVEVRWDRQDLEKELHRMGVWNCIELNANILRQLYRSCARPALDDALTLLGLHP